MTKLDKLDTDKDGMVMIRYVKDDGGYHRCVIPPEVDIDRQLTEVEVHLISMRQTATKIAERQEIKDYAIKARTDALRKTIVKAPK